MFNSRQARLNAAKSAEGVVVPVIEARDLGTDVLRDVAARYGVRISEGAQAVAVPRGAAGQVFAMNGQAQLVLVRPQLVVAGEVVALGGAIGAEAFRKGVQFRGRKGARGPSDETLARNERLMELHGRGLTDAQLGVALNVSAEYAGQVRRGLGLAANAKPTLTDLRLADTAFMARVRGLVAEGKSLTEVAGALGMDRGLLRVLLDKAGLRVQLPRKATVQAARRGREGLMLDAFKERILAEHAAGVAIRMIAKGLGKRRNAVDRALIRWGVKARPARAMNVAAVAARNAAAVERLEAGEVPAVVAGDAGISLGRLGRVWRAARAAAGKLTWFAATGEARAGVEAALRGEFKGGVGVENLMLRHGLTRRQVLAILRGGV